MKNSCFTASLRSVLSSALLISAALLSQSSASAALVFSWGGSYSPGNYTIGDPVRSGITSEATSEVSAWHYSYTTPKITGYGGPDAYGAISITNSTNIGASFFRPTYDGYYQNGATGAASIRFSMFNPAGNTGTMRGLIFFKKESFLGGAATSQVKFDENSTLAMKLSSSIGSGRNYRFAVYARLEAEGDYAWYVSQKSAAGQGDELLLDNILTSNWALWDIHSSQDAAAPVNPMPSSFTITGSNFEDIDAFGYAFQFSQSAASNTNMHLEYLRVNAEVIPEPSMALLGLGGLITTLATRGLRRSA